MILFIYETDAHGSELRCEYLINVTIRHAAALKGWTEIGQTEDRVISQASQPSDLPAAITL